VNNGYAHYNTLDVNLTHSFNRRLSMLASYTWLHATDNVDPDVPGQNSNDPNFSGRVENSNAIFDQRHRFVLSGIYIAPAGIYVGGLATLASGLPYNFTTGANNSGDGATADHPVINGVVVGRNTGRGRAIYDVSPFLEHPFGLHGDRVRLVLRAESFNVFNHANFVVYSGTWGNAATPGPGFGAPSPASPLSSRPLAAVFREGDVLNPPLVVAARALPAAGRRGLETLSPTLFSRGPNTQRAVSWPARTRFGVGRSSRDPTCS